MQSRARSAVPCDPLQAPRAQIAGLETWLQGEALAQDHAVVERAMMTFMHDLGRAYLQAIMDLRAAREVTAARPDSVPVLAQKRFRARKLETVFGSVSVTRRAWTWNREPAFMPADASLNLPPVVYSLTVSRMVAEQMADGSVERAHTALLAMGIHVPRRQCEENVVRMARDIDLFEALRPEAANDRSREDAPDPRLLVMSCDGKGVRMIPSALREATAKALLPFCGPLEADPMAPRPQRQHNKRMAALTAVWDQTLAPREPGQILAMLRREAGSQAAGKLPAPENKRVYGSLEHDMADCIRRMFDKAEQRDPHHRRRWVVLTDGSSSQIEQIRRQAEARGVCVTIVLDLLHALHYVWKAARAVFGADTDGAKAWVARHTERLLSEPTVNVVAGMRQSATVRGVSATAKEQVKKATGYLSERAWLMHYDRYLKDGLPIATGVIEGACRFLVQDRLGLTGARWGLKTAEAVLKVRALLASGGWGDYCRFYELRERQRNHPVRSAA